MELLSDKASPPAPEEQQRLAPPGSQGMGFLSLDPCPLLGDSQAAHSAADARSGIGAGTTAFLTQGCGLNPAANAEHVHVGAAWEHVTGF